jgi:hypothetical protein
MSRWGSFCLSVFSVCLSVLAVRMALADLPPGLQATKGKFDTESSVQTKALDRFAGIREGHHRSYLTAIRPPRLSAELRARVIASLPSQGEAHPSGKTAKKLLELRGVLEYHDRATDIEIKVIDVFQAAVAIHARCVILISEHALRLLSAPELQALVAHELGHEYVWEEYESARKRGDYFKIQELELWCDGVAILTLLDLGIQPESLTSGLAKLARFNARFGTPRDANEYPTDRERAEFHRAVVQIKQSPSSAE